MSIVLSCPLLNELFASHQQAKSDNDDKDGDISEAAREKESEIGQMNKEKRRREKKTGGMDGVRSPEGSSKRDSCCRHHVLLVGCNYRKRATSIA